MALRYHPDKAGSEYANKFQLITQAYIYLLNKCEQDEYQEERMTRPVTQQTYRETDENVEGVHNIYINKDKYLMMLLIMESTLSVEKCILFIKIKLLQEYKSVD